jgi:hypothetical protein
MSPHFGLAASLYIQIGIFPHRGREKPFAPYDIMLNFAAEINIKAL